MHILGVGRHPIKAQLTDLIVETYQPRSRDDAGRALLLERAKKQLRAAVTSVAHTLQRDDERRAGESLRGVALNGEGVVACGGEIGVAFANEGPIQGLLFGFAEIYQIDLQFHKYALRRRAIETGDQGLHLAQFVRRRAVTSTLFTEGSSENE